MTSALLGPNHPINIDKLIESRLLIQANSGAGKSYAIRKLCEIIYGQAQIIILDVEGEFHTLREKFDFVLAGRDGDCPADVKSAGLLARRLLELNVSTVIDIYELGAQRAKFVRLFLESLVAAPRNLWHPLIVVVDEAHMFCPEAGHSESAEAVINLMTLGRKRGFCGVLATQRLSKLHKDAAAECNNKLIGRSALDVDMKRAAAELGFTGRDDMQKLRTLPAGCFYGFGPAISDTVTQVYVGKVATTHPKAGARALVATPPRARVQKILAQLADLPQEAEAEAKTSTEMRAKIKQLESEVRTLKLAPAAKVKTEIIEKPVIPEKQIKRLEALATTVTKTHERMAEAIGEFKLVADAIRAAATVRPPTNLVPVSSKSVVSKAPTTWAPPPPPRAPHTPREAPNGDHVSEAELRILEACAWMEAIGQVDALTEPVAFLAGYTVNGHFTNMRGKLRSAGLLDYPSPGKIRMTAAGRAIAPAVSKELTRQALHTAVLDRLDESVARLLRPLLHAWPQHMTGEDLAESAGYTVNGHFTNMRGKLRSMGLVTYPEKNAVRAADFLFPEGIP
jgi:hypothetical protein